MCAQAIPGLDRLNGEIIFRGNVVGATGILEFQHGGVLPHFQLHGNYTKIAERSIPHGGAIVGVEKDGKVCYGGGKREVLSFPSYYIKSDAP